MRRLRISLLIFVISAFFVGCTITDQLSDDQQDQVATMVAATLDALDMGKDVPETETPPADPTFAPTQEPIQGHQQRIVFTDDGNLWIYEIGSQAHQLTSDGGVGRVRISSDGSQIVFTRMSSNEENRELFAISPDGSGERLLLSRADFDGLYPSPAGTEGFDVGSLAFRPGTHHLFFNTLEVFEEIGYRKTNDLFMIDLDSGELSGILPAGAGGEFVFSPDGNRIAIIRPDSISVINGDGTDYLPNVFEYSPVLTYSEFQYYVQPVWSQNSNTIGLALPSDDPLAEGVFGEVWLIPANGDPPIRQSRIEGDFYFSQVFSHPTLSPHLDRVAFTRSSGAPNQHSLFIANVDGSEEVLMDKGAINWESWAPDGVHFVYSAAEPTDLIIAVDGGSSRVTVIGINLIWIGENTFLLHTGTPGDWSIEIGSVDGSREVISHPSGDFVDFDVSE
jgi:Tol biopolymer transport system component